MPMRCTRALANVLPLHAVAGEARAGQAAPSPPSRAPWLPPLNALHAFEAAGRRLSFKAAAAELFVTPSAISRQIGALEERLGVSLFVRSHRALAPHRGRRRIPRGCSRCLR